MGTSSVIYRQALFALFLRKWAAVAAASLVALVAGCTAFRSRTVVSRAGVSISLFPGWRLLEGTNDSFQGITVFSKDEGNVSILVEKLPGDPAARTFEFEKFASGKGTHVTREKIDDLFGIKGSGVRTVAIDSEQARLENIFFYPKGALGNYYIMILIGGDPGDEELRDVMYEFPWVVRSIRKTQ
ncbi:MAG TPA: hypothetical protein VHD32_12610 [Candidatus Didemnitutus sp.]|nr:hypothetical protein [Candidatus Didemnitutus sp.]